MGGAAARLFLLCALLAASSGAAGAAEGRAIWIWEKPSFAMLDDAEARAEGLSFLVSHGITTAYLYADAFEGRNPLVEEPEKYAAWIRDAHDRGMEVHALLGSAYLRTWEYVLPAKRATALKMLADVLDYNAAQPPEGSFDGVNIDVEPYLLKEWKADRRAVAKQYLELSAAFMEMKRSKKSRIPISAAIPFWYDGIREFDWDGETKQLHQHVQDMYDFVAIMDYRDSAKGRDGIISHATDELEYAAEIGRGVVVGVETGESVPKKVTFREEGPARLEAELRIAKRAFKKYESFLGFAIHDYRAYRELVARPDGAPDPADNN